MTNIIWPKELPQMLRIDGLSGQMQTSVIRTEMDAGPAKARQRYTVATKIFSGSIIVSEDQRRILEQWFKINLGGGVLRFQMLHPQTGEYKEFRFVEDYQEVAADGKWEISMKMEQMNA